MKKMNAKIFNTERVIKQEQQETIYLSDTLHSNSMGKF